MTLLTMKYNLLTEIRTETPHVLHCELVGVVWPPTLDKCSLAVGCSSVNFLSEFLRIPDPFIGRRYDVVLRPFKGHNLTEGLRRGCISHASDDVGFLLFVIKLRR